jgi:hypothetical protein
MRAMGSYSHRKPRYETGFAITVRRDDASVAGLLRNLHLTGAKLEVTPTFRVGEIITFRLLDTDVRARVLWSKGTQAGVTFARPITPTLVRTLHRQVDGWVTY